MIPTCLPDLSSVFVFLPSFGRASVPTNFLYLLLKDAPELCVEVESPRTGVIANILAEESSLD